MVFYLCYSFKKGRGRVELLSDVQIKLKLDFYHNRYLCVGCGFLKSCGDFLLNCVIYDFPCLAFSITHMYKIYVFIKLTQEGQRKLTEIIKQKTFQFSKFVFQPFQALPILFPSSVTGFSLPILLRYNWIFGEKGVGFGLSVGGGIQFVSLSALGVTVSGISPAISLSLGVGF